LALGVIDRVADDEKAPARKRTGIAQQIVDGLLRHLATEFNAETADTHGAFTGGDDFVAHDGCGWSAGCGHTTDALSNCASPGRAAARAFQSVPRTVCLRRPGRRRCAWRSRSWNRP